MKPELTQIFICKILVTAIYFYLSFDSIKVVIRYFQNQVYACHTCKHIPDPERSPLYVRTKAAANPLLNLQIALNIRENTLKR